MERKDAPFRWLATELEVEKVKALISVLELKETDVIVVKITRNNPNYVEMSHMKKALLDAFNSTGITNKIMVVPNDVEISVIRKDS